MASSFHHIKSKGSDLARTGLIKRSGPIAGWATGGNPGEGQRLFALPNPRIHQDRAHHRQFSARYAVLVHQNGSDRPVWLFAAGVVQKCCNSSK